MLNKADQSPDETASKGGNKNIGEHFYERDGV